MKTTPHDALARQLRAAIGESGASLLSLSKRAELPYWTLWAFVRQDRDVQLSTASKIATALGLELRPLKRKARGPGKRQRITPKDRRST